MQTAQAVAMTDQAAKAPSPAPERMRSGPEVEAMLGLPAGALGRARRTASGPPFFRLSGKVVVYRVGDVSRWLQQCAVDGRRLEG